MRFRHFLIMLLIAGFAGSALSQREGNPANWCRGGSFAFDSEEFSLGTVIGKKGTRIYFHDDASDECPVSEKCRGKAYLVPGDKVVIARTFQKFACSWYSPAKGLPTVGWIKAADLRITNPNPNPPVSAWLGDWSYSANTISFTHNKLAGYLNVTGEAFWKGFGDNIHIGELDDRAKPAGNQLKVGERETDGYACKATIRLINNFLVVRDNMNCGGVNVTFSGVYRKKK